MTTTVFECQQNLCAMSCDWSILVSVQYSSHHELSFIYQWLHHVCGPSAKMVTLNSW